MVIRTFFLVFIISVFYLSRYFLSRYIVNFFLCPNLFNNFQFRLMKTFKKKMMPSPESDSEQKSRKDDAHTAPKGYNAFAVGEFFCLKKIMWMCMCVCAGAHVRALKMEDILLMSFQALLEVEEFWYVSGSLLSSTLR